jgi:hypothetical protein
LLCPHLIHPNLPCPPPLLSLQTIPTALVLCKVSQADLVGCLA